MDDVQLPQGFLAAGGLAGVKAAGKDLGILVAEAPAVWAAVTTRNRACAPSISRTERLRTTRADDTMRAVIVVSGNANVLNGPAGAEDDERLATHLASALGVASDSVLTASTGGLGNRMPMDKIEQAIPKVLEGLSRSAKAFAGSIVTTDRYEKVASKDIFLRGCRIRIVGIAKGAGMIAPNMATMLGFVATDASISKKALDRALRQAVDGSFNRLTVDEDMSTNDMVLALASGAAPHPTLEEHDADLEVFTRGLSEVLLQLAKAIARDGEGANHLLEVCTRGYEDRGVLGALGRSVASSMLVKAGLFGQDPTITGRIVAALGAKSAGLDFPLNLATLKVAIQGVTTFSDSRIQAFDQQALRLKMAEADIRVDVDVGVSDSGDAMVSVLGCDLSYEYVKINADYRGSTGGALRAQVSERLAELSPNQKKGLLIEALRYIDLFRGARAVIKLGGSTMVDPELERLFAEDVLLLKSVGLLPIVVHGGGPEISRTLEQLGQTSRFVDGLRVTDEASMHVVEMVLTGSVNQRLVAALNKTGSRAVGLSGKDGGLIRAKPLKSPHGLGQVGEIESLDVRLIDLLEQDGYVPVVSPVGLGPGGHAFNINADVVAAELAHALGAKKLIFLSDVPGLLEGEAVVSDLTSEQLKARLDRGAIGGGMKPKLESSLRALSLGVESVHLVDGRVPHNIVAELFTDKGVGTLIRRS
jgi:acetylglutamate kinase